MTLDSNIRAYYFTNSGKIVISPQEGSDLVLEKDHPAYAKVNDMIFSGNINEKEILDTIASLSKKEHSCCGGSCSKKAKEVPFPSCGKLDSLDSDPKVVTNDLESNLRRQRDDLEGSGIDIHIGYKAIKALTKYIKKAMYEN